MGTGHMTLVFTRILQLVFTSQDPCNSGSAVLGDFHGEPETLSWSPSTARGHRKEMVDIWRLMRKDT